MEVERLEADGVGSASGGGGKSPTDADAAESTSLRRLSEEMASKDGTADGMPVPIPESNDGVMDDKNRVGPETRGQPGTEGGRIRENFIELGGEGASCAKGGHQGWPVKRRRSRLWR